MSLSFVEVGRMYSQMCKDFHNESENCRIYGTIFKFEWTHRCFSECRCEILLEAYHECQKRTLDQLF